MEKTTFFFKTTGIQKDQILELKRLLGIFLPFPIEENPEYLLMDVTILTGDSRIILFHFLRSWKESKLTGIDPFQTITL